MNKDTIHTKNNVFHVQTHVLPVNQLIFAQNVHQDTFWEEKSVLPAQKIVKRVNLALQIVCPVISIFNYIEHDVSLILPLSLKLLWISTINRLAI